MYQCATLQVVRRRQRMIWSRLWGEILVSAGKGFAAGNICACRGVLGVIGVV